MNSDAVEFSSPAQPFPRLRQVYERLARQPTFDDELAGSGFRPHREVAQYHQGGIAQKEGFGPVLLSGRTMLLRSQSTQSQRACNTSFTRAPVNNNSLIAAAA
jgi:hypothetical protein